MQSMTQAHLDLLGLKGDDMIIKLVPCKPLGTLMHAAGLLEADFLSLDVEGEELSVLQNANLSALKVVLVETDGDSPSKEAAIRELLVRSGFWLAYELRLGPRKGGGYGDVFVRTSLRVPDLELAVASSNSDGDRIKIRFRTAADPSPQRFVNRICKQKACDDCVLQQKCPPIT